MAQVKGADLRRPRLAGRIGGQPVVTQQLYRMASACCRACVVDALRVALRYALLRRASGVPFNWDGSVAYLASLAYLTVIGSVIAFVGYLTLFKAHRCRARRLPSAAIPVIAMIISTIFEDYV
jgi:hypothetical protein